MTANSRRVQGYGERTASARRESWRRSHAALEDRADGAWRETGGVGSGSIADSAGRVVAWERMALPRQRALGDTGV